MTIERLSVFPAAKYQSKVESAIEKTLTAISELR